MHVPDTTTGADEKPTVVLGDDPKEGDSGKRPSVPDQKQSFVDQVSEGLA